MKVKAEKVTLLVFGKNRTFRIEKGVKIKDDIIMRDGNAYTRRLNTKNSLLLFLQSRVEPAKGEQVKIEDLYKAYVDFCEEYGFDIMNTQKFVEVVDDYLEVDAVNGVVKNVRLTDRRIRIENDADVYIFEKTGLFTKKKIPVYLVVEGVPKTITFDELKSYAEGTNGEIVSLDDFTLGQMLSESMFIGATIGTQKLFADLKWLLMIVLALTIIAVMISSYSMIQVQQVLNILKKII